MQKVIVAFESQSNSEKIRDIIESGARLADAARMVLADD